MVITTSRVDIKCRQCGTLRSEHSEYMRRLHGSAAQNDIHPYVRSLMPVSREVAIDCECGNVARIEEGDLPREIGDLAAALRGAGWRFNAGGKRWECPRCARRTLNRLMG